MPGLWAIRNESTGTVYRQSEKKLDCRRNETFGLTTINADGAPSRVETDVIAAVGGCLFTLFELDRRCHRLPVAQHLDLDHIAHFAAPQRIREVVKVLDRFVAELHHDVSGFQSCLRRGRSRSYIRELYAGFHLAKIRDRSEVRSVTAAAARPASRLVFGDHNESRTLVRIRQQ